VSSVVLRHSVWKVEFTKRDANAKTNEQQDQDYIRKQKVLVRYFSGWRHDK
jgi:hypothetical protein